MARIFHDAGATAGKAGDGAGASAGASGAVERVTPGGIDAAPAPRRRPSLLLAAALLALAGCSSQAWYESARSSAELECQKQPAGAYEECMSRVNKKSYEDYRREREAVKQAP